MFWRRQPRRSLIGTPMLAVVLCVGTAASDVTPVWPPYPDPDHYRAAVDAAVEQYLATRPDYSRFMVAYDPAGDYLGWSVRRWTASPKLRFDPAGIPMVLYGDAFHYNPVTVAQFALAQHGRGETADFLATARFLRDRLLGTDGALRFDFEYRYYLGALGPGWTSAMAQGQALSVLSRAYRLERDGRWLDAGRLVLSHLFSTSSGLAPSLAAINPGLADLYFFAEYPASPPEYTLNGAMFTMLGLYDWSRLSVDDPTVQAARRAFDESLVTLGRLLPYYDMGRISAYDLSYLTHHRQPHFGANYHEVHVYLLHALVSVTGDATLRRWEDRWAGYF